MTLINCMKLEQFQNCYSPHSKYRPPNKVSNSRSYHLSFCRAKSDPALRERTESTCPGLPWKDPETISSDHAASGSSLHYDFESRHARICHPLDQWNQGKKFLSSHLFRCRWWIGLGRARAIMLQTQSQLNNAIR